MTASSLQDAREGGWLHSTDVVQHKQQDICDPVPLHHLFLNCILCVFLVFKKKVLSSRNSIQLGGFAANRFRKKIKIVFTPRFLPCTSLFGLESTANAIIFTSLIFCMFFRFREWILKQWGRLLFSLNIAMVVAALLLLLCLAVPTTSQSCGASGNSGNDGDCSGQPARCVVGGFPWGGPSELSL